MVAPPRFFLIDSMVSIAAAPQDDLDPNHRRRSPAPAIARNSHQPMEPFGSGVVTGPFQTGVNVRPTGEAVPHVLSFGWVVAMELRAGVARTDRGAVAQPQA